MFKVSLIHLDVIKTRIHHIIYASMNSLNLKKNLTAIRNNDHARSIAPLFANQFQQFLNHNTSRSL